jgi:hypothetical protein
MLPGRDSLRLSISVDPLDIAEASVLDAGVSIAGSW